MLFRQYIKFQLFREVEGIEILKVRGCCPKEKSLCNLLSDCLMTLQSKTDIRFSAFLCNICRLEKNTSFVHDIIQTVETQPNIIAISESEIRNSIQIYFINTNSRTRAGGVGLPLSSELV